MAGLLVFSVRLCDLCVSLFSVAPRRYTVLKHAPATERGYADIVAILRDQAHRHSPASGAAADMPVPAALLEALKRGDEEGVIASLEAHPSLIHTAEPHEGMTALHWASASLWDRLGAWLIERGADVSAPGRGRKR